MRPRFTVGIGCRKGCTGEAIASLVRRALVLAVEADGTPDARQASRDAVMFTSELKSAEAGLVEAAARLGM
ncbi:MAG: cobalamin biosynthesis protein, partial [Hyphomicrobiales bacterium]|nr:cobalamin biosynthesis protein [Hyphomicrobiales bacterium]